MPETTTQTPPPCVQRVAEPPPLEIQRQLAQAVGFHRQRRFDDAERIYRAILQQSPAQFDATHLLGLLLIQRGRLDDGIATIRRALEIDPLAAAAYNNLGPALRALGRTDEALAAYDKAVELKPDFDEAHYNRGNLLKDLGKYDEAIASYDRALAIRPNMPQVWSNRGNVLLALKRLPEALASLDKAIELNPGFAVAHSNRGNVLMEMKRFDEAADAYRRALALDPHNPETNCNLGSYFYATGRHAEAIGYFARTLAANPAHAIANRNDAYARLALGDFSGWDKADWRLKLPDAPPVRHADRPQWTGERIDGVLLAWAEQGLGENILYASMADDLARYASRVTLEVEPRLVQLFRRSFPNMDVAPQGESASAIRADACIALGSLGKFLRRGWSAFPEKPRAYLTADPARAADLRARLVADGRKPMGVSWLSRNAEFGEHKSARLADFLPLLRLPDYRFVDLQYGDTRAEREALAAEHGIVVERLDDIDNTDDIDGLAALIAALDHVVTVSNTTAHLAGALGAPTTVLLPSSLGKLWHWFEGREYSPWYPTVRLVRQNGLEPWDSVVNRAAANLRTA